MATSTGNTHKTQCVRGRLRAVWSAWLSASRHASMHWVALTLSVISIALFGGLTMLLWPEAHFVIIAFGVACLAWAAYALYAGVRGFLEA